MKCPICNIEAKIGRTESVVEEGYVLKILHFVCRNQRCDRYNKEVGKKEVREPLEEPIEEPIEKEKKDEGSK